MVSVELAEVAASEQQQVRDGLEPNVAQASSPVLPAISYDTPGCCCEILKLVRHLSLHDRDPQQLQ